MGDDRQGDGHRDRGVVAAGPAAPVVARGPRVLLNQLLRERFGVKRVTVLRPVDRDDDTTVFVIGEVEGVEQAEGLLAALREDVFSRAAFVVPPKATVTEVETITQD